MNRTRHPELLEILRNADLVTADGMPIVWASRLMGKRLKQRVSGSDLVPKIAEEAARRKKSIYFLGGREGIAGEAARILKLKFPDLIISGVLSPIVRVEGQELMWAERDDLPIVKTINDSRNDYFCLLEIRKSVCQLESLRKRARKQNNINAELGAIKSKIDTASKLINLRRTISEEDFLERLEKLEAEIRKLTHGTEKK